MTSLYECVFDDDELAFRDEVDAFVASYPGLDPRQFFHGRNGPARDLYRALGERGWLRQCWPQEWEGRRLPVSYEFLMWDVLAERRAARPDIGPGLIAHAIIAHGTPAQQARYLPGLGSGELACSLGYSEPEAGSDLTHLRTRAIRDGDVYRVTGHKIWTSEAHHASRIWLLCRTGDGAEGKAGLTLLFADLRLPGITVTPVHTMDGHHVNEVFFDDVEVPIDDRVGDEGSAWTIIRQSLAVERHIQVLPGRLRRDLLDLRIALDAAGLGGAREAEHCYEQLASRAAVVEAASLSTVSELVAGGTAAAAAARAKLLGAELCQAIPRAGLTLLGTAVTVGDSDLAFLWRQSILETIAGGTVEIMLSLLAREELGLGSGR